MGPAVYAIGSYGSSATGSHSSRVTPSGPTTWAKRPFGSGSKIFTTSTPRAETTALYRVVADHVETMLQDARDRSPHGFGLPRHVERSFRRYLDCGVLARGFARVRCAACHDEVLVPFSCKTRGLCPSCRGRRMADAAAHLLDRVLPSADYRQWTTRSFPRWLRLRLLRDPTLVSELLTAFVRFGFAHHRRRARALGVPLGYAADF